MILFKYILAMLLIVYCIHILKIYYHYCYYYYLEHKSKPMLVLCYYVCYDNIHSDINTVFRKYWHKYLLLCGYMYVIIIL